MIVVWHVHPWVLPNLIRCRPLVPIVREKPQDQVFEGIAQVVAVDLLEVKVESTAEDESVEVLFLARLLEWEDALHDDEKDNAEAEQVDLGAIVPLAFFYFRGHVGHRAAIRFERVD